MLPIPMLDDEGFGEIVENAKRLIPQISSRWTDFNSHDPGITMLELFAFLKESQQYHLDQIGPHNLQKYLKLLGAAPRPRTAATPSCEVNTNHVLHCTLPRGTRLMAGEIPFSLLTPVPLDTPRLTDGFAWDGSRVLPFVLDGLGMGTKLHIEPFGRNPSPGSALFLHYADAPDLSRPLRLFVSVEEADETPRVPVPVQSEFLPLADLSWAIRTPEGWHSLQVVADETCGLLFTGEITLTLGTQLVDFEENLPIDPLDHGCWLRMSFHGGQYDVPPILTGLSDRMTAVVQQDTMAEQLLLAVETVAPGVGKLVSDGILAATGKYEVYCPGTDGLWQLQTAIDRVYHPASGTTDFTFALPSSGADEALLLTWREAFSPYRRLDDGDGFPNQQFALPHKGLVSQAFVLLSEAPDAPGGWAMWHQVRDFDSSGPEDLHYVLDEESGTLSFGNCFHGQAPEGGLLIAGLATTLGEDGNAKSGQIRTLHREDRGILPLGITPHQVAPVNPDNAHGGRNRESLDACLQRCHRQLRKSDRGVTYEDFERLVFETPGLRISNCKAIPVTALPRQDGSLPEDCITLVVEPFSLHQIRQLSPAYRANILAHLEPRRMLGTKVHILSPEYIGISIYAEILSLPHYVDAKERIHAAVTQFFATGWSFGTPVRYGTLYGIIDTLPCVSRVESLTIDAQGKGIFRGVNGDVILPHNGLPILQEAVYQVRPAES